MRFRKRTWLGLLLATLVASGIALYAVREWQRRAAEARATTGTLTYHCSSQSGAMDFDPRTIGPTELSLTVHRIERGRGDWTVQLPGRKAVHATIFAADTGSYGGSHGLRWRAGDGKSVSATLSFSDLHGEFGTETIWVALGRRRLFCGPDPASYRQP